MNVLGEVNAAALPTALIVLCSFDLYRMYVIWYRLAYKLLSTNQKSYLWQLTDISIQNMASLSLSTFLPGCMLVVLLLLLLNIKLNLSQAFFFPTSLCVFHFHEFESLFNLYLLWCVGIYTPYEYLLCILHMVFHRINSLRCALALLIFVHSTSRDTNTKFSTFFFFTAERMEEIFILL